MSDEAFSGTIQGSASLAFREPAPYRLAIDVVRQDGVGCSDCGVIVQRYDIVYCRTSTLAPGMSFITCRACGEKALTELRAWARTHHEAG